MCGIVGILKKHPGAVVEADRLARMRDVIAHRGPDGKGLWLDGQVGFGHRRLAIVDIVGGHQPMRNGSGSLCVTYNGEIYNHEEIRRSLQRRGHVYHSRSDTESLLHLYEEDGERCVEVLQGMFAFALWDAREKKLLLARDRLGIKPLYYAETENEFLFGSEIKAILAARGVDDSFNRAAVPQYLANGFTTGDATFFSGVRKLLPGRTLTWSAKEGVSIRRYWEVPAPGEPREGEGTMAEWAAEVRTGLVSAVNSHLMSDVPLGVFLSGGIDSSALAALVAKLAKTRIKTFSVGFSNTHANELDFARLAAGHIGSDHSEVVLPPGAFFGSLGKLIWHEDEPIAFPSSVPLYFVSQLARKHVKVVLTGEGADELFLGYNRYRVTAWNARLANRMHVLPRALLGAGRRMVEALPGKLRRMGSRSFLALPPGPRALYYDNFSIFNEEAQRSLLLADVAPDHRDPYAELLELYGRGSGDDLDRMTYADLQSYLVELLMKQDQMSMAASIESRVPFLDHVFLENSMDIPNRFKLQGVRTKAVLRAAVRDLVPKEILTRKKMGFPTPVGAWLRGPFSHVLDELVLSPRAMGRELFEPSAIERLVQEHRGGAANHAHRLWLLMNLEVWQRLFVEKEEPEEITATLEEAGWKQKCVSFG